MWINVILCCRRTRGEREAGHKGTREVGNVDPDTEITFQFGANEQDAQGEKQTGVPLPDWRNKPFSDNSLILLCLFPYFGAKF